METNPGPWRPVPAVCRIFCSNVWGLAGTLSDPTVASYQYDILLCSETLVSDVRHVSELLVPRFGSPVLCRGMMPLVRGMGAYVRDAWLQSISQPKFECGCVMLVLGFVVRDRIFMCSVFTATLT